MHLNSARLAEHGGIVVGLDENGVAVPEAVGDPAVDVAEVGGMGERAAVALHHERERARGVVAASAGNHALGILDGAAHAALLEAAKSGALPRRDFELALQVGHKDALNAFLAQHPHQKLPGRG